jgi:23S rRNA (cytosine1962-C5)-methyltransferase
MGKVVLTGKGRRWVEGGHPWIYTDDIVEGEGEPGELLPVHAPDMRRLGWGLFSTHSRISVRLVTRDTEQPNRAFWLERAKSAIAVRDTFGYLEPEGACRLIAGDADGFPGFVLDRYADVLVVQSGCQGSDRMRDFLLEVVREALDVPITGVLDRSDTGVRKLENLEKRVEWIDGAARESVLVREGDLRYAVDVVAGHKTGHYLDQRENRARAASHADGRRVLDAFAYDGLFGIRAALAGAESVVCLEQSAAAVERLIENAKLNGVEDRVEVQRVDAMVDLRERAREEQRFDLVLVDPPAFARNRKEAAGAARGYRELNLRAAALTAPGGRLVSSSCSHAVKQDAFLGHIAGALRDARRGAWLEALTGAAPDHPHRLDLPETAYLKCAFLRLD